jgi:hypothetical protein
VYGAFYRAFGAYLYRQFLLVCEPELRLYDDRMDSSPISMRSCGEIVRNGLRLGGVVRDHRGLLS